MTLNDFECCDSPYFAFSPNSVDFQADYITVFEARPKMSVKYCPPFQFPLLAKTIMHFAVWSVCDSWLSCVLYCCSALLSNILGGAIYTVSQKKTSPMFFAITRGSIVGFS